MTITIHTEENESRELAVTVEVEEARVQKEMRKTARQLSRRLNIPGFRKGKAPFGVIASYMGGKEAIRAEAVESLVQPIFKETLDQLEQEPYAQASFDDMELEPLILKFTVPLAPTVELGEYRALRKEIEEVTVTDEALAEALERIQARHADIEEVDRPAELSDQIVLSGKGELVIEQPDIESSDAETADADSGSGDDGDETDEDPLAAEADQILEAENQVIFNEERLEIVLDADKVFPNTDFINHVIGMSAGDESTFTIAFPDDYEDEELAGKEAQFNIVVNEVKKRDLPELDDELAKLEGDFETLDELKDSVQKQLFEQAQSEARNQLIEETISDILKEAKLVFPEAAVEQEINGMVANFKQQAERSGWSWEDFLKLQGGNEDAIRQNFRETAVEQVNRSLVLRQLVIEEKISVEAEDVEAKVEERIIPFEDNPELKENMRNYYQSGYGFDMISSEILMDKVYDRIVAILSGQAPDLDSLEDAASDQTEEE